MVQRKYLEEAEVVTCSLERTIEIGVCTFDSLLIGIPERPIIDEPMVLSARECRRLYEEKILMYQDHEFPVQNLNAFSAQVGLHGTSSKVDGTCVHAQSFDFRNTHYPNHWIMATIKGTFIGQFQKYDSFIILVVNSYINIYYSRESNCHKEKVRSSNPIY